MNSYELQNYELTKAGDINAERTARYENSRTHWVTFMKGV